MRGSNDSADECRGCVEDAPDTQDRAPSLCTALGNSRGRRFIPSLAATCPLIPTLASVVTLLVYVAWDSPYSLLAGGAAALGTWFLIALLNLNAATVELANIRTYGDFRDRLKQLDIKICLLEEELPENPDPDTPAHMRLAALCEAKGHRAFLGKEMKTQDMRWVRAHGYNNLWIALHAAEEQMIVAGSNEAAAADGLHDEARLLGSEIPHSDKLLARVRNAVYVLDDSAQEYFLEKFNPPAKGGSPSVAKGVLAAVRCAINEFNDNRYDALARTRNVFLDMVPFGGLVAWAVLAMSILATVDTKQLEAAGAFYFAGVVAGLLYRWYVEVKTESTIQDFGLASSRLLRTLVFSGIAGVVGVLLYAAVPASMGIHVIPDVHTDQTSAQAAAASTTTATCPPDKGVPPLDCTFNLKDNWFSGFIALVFGAAPELLLSVLKLEGDTYLKQVKSTMPAESGSQS